MNTNELAAKVIKCAKKVHDNLGNGFDEKTYIKALEIEVQKYDLILRSENRKEDREANGIPIFYDGKQIGIKTIDYWIEEKNSSKLNKIIIFVIDDDKQREILQSKTGYGIVDDNIVAMLFVNFSAKDFDYRIISTSQAKEKMILWEKFIHYFSKCVSNCCYGFSEFIFIIIPFVILFCLSDDNSTLLLFSIPLFSFYLSSFIFLYFIIVDNNCEYIDDSNMFEYCVGVKNKEQCICKDNMLRWEYSVRRKWISKVDWLIEKIILWFVYNIYLRIDTINDFIRLANPVKENLTKPSKGKENCKRIDIIIDIYVPMLTILGIYLYVKIDRGNLFDIICCSFFIWRILTILFIKLNEILSHKIGGMHYSFNRSFIYFITNIIDVTVGYSFLYSSYYFNMIQERGTFKTIFATLKIFTEWFSEKAYYPHQSLLVLSQVFVFIILISVFLTTLPNLNYLRKK